MRKTSIGMFAVLLIGLSSTEAVLAKNPGCEVLSRVQQLLRMETVVGKTEEIHSQAQLVREAFKTICQSSASDGSTLYYANGRYATTSANTVGATWYYPNGNYLSTSAGSQGATWYYPNGKYITSSAQTKGATWYYSNGNYVTTSMDSTGATWYYPNGKYITTSAGVQGATWYYENGNYISTSVGSRGATWYCKNGKYKTTSGGEISAEDLLDVPGILFEYTDFADSRNDDRDSVPEASQKVIKLFSQLADSEKLSVKEKICK